MSHHFENLEVWKRACALSVFTYKAVASCQNFTFKDQMTRYSLSIPSNIAEGSERNSYKEFIRFLYISKSSSAELRTQSYIAQKIKLIAPEQTKHIIEESKEISAMLQGLINQLSSRID